MAFTFFVHEKQKQKNDIALLNVLTSTTQQQQQQNDIALVICTYVNKRGVDVLLVWFRGSQEHSGSVH